MLFRSTVDGRHFATPRGWEDLSHLIQVYEKMGKTVDREVVVQYIQFPQIAKDFANYLELYYKYHTDYRIEEILKGNLDQVMLKKVAHASFDERLSVLGLLLSRIHEILKSVVQKEDYLERLQACLLEYKKQAELKPEETDGQNKMTELLRKYNEDYKKLKKAELLDAQTQRQYHSVLDSLSEFELVLLLENIVDRSEAFSRIKELFEEKNQAFENEFEQASKTLEYVFDFLEGAFGNSQEMVMFITELNSNFHCVSFLQEYECERYYYYNKELLFDDKRKNLLHRISDL